MRIAVLTIGAIAVIGGTTSITQANPNAQVFDVESSDPLPPLMEEYVKHPDFIQTKDGLFEKKTQPEQNYSQDEITNNNSLDTTQKTKMLVYNDDIYIKEEDNK